jgi:CheY-like chemotaxis protein
VENEVEPRAIQALLVTPDPFLVTAFTAVCRELGIEVRTTAGNEGIIEELQKAKYEGILVDFDTAPDPTLMLDALRRSPSNRNAVAFAVATKADHRRQAQENGINLLFHRPFDAREVRRVLHGAHDLMVRERRRYFRCVAEVPVLLLQTRSGTDCKCKTINVSSNGVALKGAFHLQPGEELQLILFLQGIDKIVRAIGTVVWDDKHGKTGISFKCANPQYQIELDSWLNDQFHLRSLNEE